jgi:hypothetical protein
MGPLNTLTPRLFNSLLMFFYSLRFNQVVALNTPNSTVNGVITSTYLPSENCFLYMTATVPGVARHQISLGDESLRERGLANGYHGRIHGMTFGGGVLSHDPYQFISI